MKSTWRVILLLSIALFAAACDSGAPAVPTTVATDAPTAAPSDTPQPTPTIRPRAVDLTRATDPAQQAAMRIVNAAPDTPPLQVYIERLTVATNLAFGQSTLPSGIVEGDFKLRIVPSGSRLDEDTPLLEADFRPRGGQSLILVITGSGGALSLSSFSESTEPLERGRSRVTFIHTLAGGPEVTLQTGETPLTPPLAFGAAALPAVLASENLDLSVVAGGAPLLTYPIQLEERTSYTLLLVGQPDAPAIVQAELRVPGTASIRAVNVAAGGAVDLYLDDLLLATGLDYTRANERQSFPARVLNFSAYPAGSDRASVEPLITQEVVANDDDSLTLILMGTTDDPRLVEARDDLSPTPANRARMGFVNAFPGLPRVRVETQSGSIADVGELGFGQPPQTTLLEIQPYSFRWITVEGDPATGTEYAENVLLEQGRSYLYLMTGRLDAPPLILSESVGFEPPLEETTPGDAPAVTTEIPTRLRFVNAMRSGTPLDIDFDGGAMATNLGYSDGSDFMVSAQGDHNMVVRNAQTGDTLAESAVYLEGSADYTVVVHGFSTDAVFILLVPDTGIVSGDDAPYLRLLNLTRDVESHLGLATSPASDPGSSRLNAPPPEESFRWSLSFNMKILPGIDIASGRPSGAILAPPGISNLHIIDTRVEQVAATILGVTLEPGRHYDVFAFQHPDSPRVEGFVLAYAQN